MNIIYIEPNRHPNTKQIRYTIDNITKCWECTSHSIQGYYPQVSRQGKRWIMSRYIYTILYGKISQDLVVRHKCDNPLCINPDHLELGTQLENMEDAIRRNRINKGSQVPTAKLDETTAKLIKEEYQSGTITQQQLAHKYNISRSMISFIANNIYWKHI